MSPTRIASKAIPSERELRVTLFLGQVRVQCERCSARAGLDRRRCTELALCAAALAAARISLADLEATPLSEEPQPASPAPSSKDREAEARTVSGDHASRTFLVRRRCGGEASRAVRSHADASSWLLVLMLAGDERQAGVVACACRSHLIALVLGMLVAFATCEQGTVRASAPA